MTTDDAADDGRDTAEETGQDAAGDAPDGDSRLRSLVATTPRKIVVAVVVLVLALVVAYLLGLLGVPSAGLVDRGDWGTVTEDRTEVVTTIWVDNPNPFGISLGSGLSASYNVSFNDVALASGGKDAISVPAGNSTMQLRSDLRNDRLPAWWVSYVRANETIDVSIDGELRVDVGPGASYPIQQNQTVLADSTPIISALSAAASGTEGTYTRSVDSSAVSDDALSGELSDATTVTVGYEIRNGSARWGDVTESETEVVFEFTVHNPGDVPVPAVPDGLGVQVDMNDVTMFEGDTGALAASSVGPDAVIEPGETRTVTYTVRMQNDKIDDWFTSHVRRGERTTVGVGVQLVFDVPATGTTIRVPSESPSVYECSLQTAILVDGQATSTNCGEIR